MTVEKKFLKSVFILNAPYFSLYLWKIRIHYKMTQKTLLMNKLRCPIPVNLIILNLFFSLIFIGCDNEPGGAGNEIPVSSLVGEWLLSTSDKDEQTVFTIKEEPFDFWVEIKRGEKTILGFGNRFSVAGGVMSGKYVTQTEEFKDFSWNIKDVKPLEIMMEEAGEKGTTSLSLYRLTGDLDLECSSINTPDYAAITGMTGFSEFRVLDTTVAEVDSKTGELSVGAKPGSTYIIATTPSGTCAIALESHKGNEPDYKGETWVCDIPSEQRWVRMIFPAGEEGEIEVHRSAYGQSCVMYEYMWGKYSLAVDNLTVSLSGSSLPQPELLKMQLLTRSDSEIALREADREPVVFRRVVKSIVISPKEKHTPNYPLVTGGAGIQGYKSHNESVATVNASGEITGISEGIAFVDILTDKGVFILEVDVDGGIIPYPFEEMFSLDGSMTLNPLCHIFSYYLGPLKDSTNTTRWYEDVRPILSSVVLGSAVGKPLRSISVYYTESVTPEEVIGALGAKFTLLESETTDECITYINSKELSEASVKIEFNYSSNSRPGASVHYESLKVANL